MYERPSSGFLTRRTSFFWTRRSIIALNVVGVIPSCREISPGVAVPTTFSQLVTADSAGVTSLPSTICSISLPDNCDTTKGCRKRPGLTVVRFRIILVRHRNISHRRGHVAHVARGLGARRAERHGEDRRLQPAMRKRRIREVPVRRQL